MNCGTSGPICRPTVLLYTVAREKNNGNMPLWVSRRRWVKCQSCVCGAAGEQVKVNSAVSINAREEAGRDAHASAETRNDF